MIFITRLSSASLELTDDPYVHMLGRRYKSVNFGTEKNGARPTGEPEQNETGLDLERLSVSQECVIQVRTQ